MFVKIFSLLICVINIQSSTAISCEGVKCGENAECLVISQKQHCKCIEGFIGQPIEKCWKPGEDICDPNPCGPNSICKHNWQGTFCSCASDHFGRPPNCFKPECRTDDECAKGSFCKADINNQTCIEGCNDDDLCKVDEYCNHNIQKCEKGCRYDHSCKIDEYCNFDIKKCEKGCRSDSDCEENSYCKIEDDTQTCEKGCRNDDSCSTDEYCKHSTHTCEKGCRSHDDCEKNSFCYIQEESQKCEEGCRSDQDCAQDSYCKIQDKSRKCEKGCRNDDSCEKGQICEYYTHQCKLYCSSDKNCLKDQFCDPSNDCVSPCDSNPCGSNSICKNANNTAYCSCEEGFISRTGEGCKQKDKNEDYSIIESDKLEELCKKYCGYDAKCEKLDNKIECYCEGKYRSNKKPFENCYLLPSTSRPTQTSTHRYSGIKPGQDVPLSSLSLTAILNG